MKKIDEYGKKICGFQAELFKDSIVHQACSSKIFIRRFMNSELAERIDSNGFFFESSGIIDAFEDLDEEYGPTDYGKIKYSTEELYWMGYIYRYWSYIASKSSKQIYKMIKPDELRKLYFPYHSLDPEQAIERIMEAKGMDEKNEIARGVEIMRRVRKKHSAE
jgi:hypothetical protein